ncbi:unnamed protein product, partial [Symbiodinium sp. CCMP2592]
HEVEEEEERASTRRDIHGNDWNVLCIPHQGQSRDAVIQAEWGMNKCKVVNKKIYSYVYCRCNDAGCPMVVKYTMEDQVVKRESKFEHPLPKALRDTIREVAEIPGTAAASLVTWSQENPNAADADIPTCSQVSRRKALQRVRHQENSIKQVQALVSYLQEREVGQDWEFEILAEDMAQGIRCFSCGFYMSVFEEHKTAIRQHGLRLGCDATHEISNSRVKLFALGWLAQHDDEGVIRNTFIPLAFALALSEDSNATELLLQSTDRHLQEACGCTLKEAKVAHLDGGTGLVKGFQDYFGTAVPLARSLQHIKRNIQKEGVKKLRRTSWWDTVQRWVSFSAFLRNDSVFDRFWHHALAILRRHDEDMFEQYLASDILSQSGGKWTAAWRAGPLEPGYGPYALNSVDSFFKILDHYVPEEAVLPLIDVVSKYEHVGRIFQHEQKWSELWLAVSTLCTPAILGEIPNSLTERLEHFHGKQVRRMSVAGIKRLLEGGKDIRVEVAVDGATTSVFCKYHPDDFDEQKMRILATLEMTSDAEGVDASFLALEALTEEKDGTHFHPRVLRTLYSQFTTVYPHGAATLESHQDFGQAGMTEHYALCQLEKGVLALPDKFSSLKKQSHPTGRPKGRPKGVAKKIAKAPARGRGGGRSGRGGRKRKASEAALPALESADDVLADCFALDPLEVASAKGETVLRPDPAPGTPPDLAGRFSIMMEEGILPATTQVKWLNVPPYVSQPDMVPVLLILGTGSLLVFEADADISVVVCISYSPIQGASSTALGSILCAAFPLSQKLVAGSHASLLKMVLLMRGLLVVDCDD